MSFCHECIRTWRMQSLACPMCRTISAKMIRSKIHVDSRHSPADKTQLMRKHRRCSVRQPGQEGPTLRAMPVFRMPSRITAEQIARMDQTAARKTATHESGREGGRFQIYAVKKMDSAAGFEDYIILFYILHIFD